MIDFKGSHFERDVILWGVCWYVAYSISYRQLEEMMEERGVEVDHSTLNRWVVKYMPELDCQFRSPKRPVGSSWRLDKTYVTIRGRWKYLYRAVDKSGDTVDFPVMAKREAPLHRPERGGRAKRGPSPCSSRRSAFFGLRGRSRRPIGWR
ncbi:IS6 family transposase [Methylosinus sporium]|uniref:IS6 family transposase n=1 Tax=Methylosinus sporium TaxID=428 RepID=UPI00383A57D1